MTLHQVKFTLYIMERFFTKRVASHCNWLLRNVTAPNLSELKEHQENALDDMFQFQVFV